MDLGHWTLGEGVILPEDFEENPPLRICLSNRKQRKREILHRPEENHQG